VSDWSETLDAASLRRQVRARHPRLRIALVADARMTAMHRMERHRFRSLGDTLAQILRLMWCSDAFLAHALYRVKARLQALGVPVLPRIAHRLAMAIAQVSIGDPVVMEPGVYIVHGQVVIDGIVEIGRGTVIRPFVTIGLRPGTWLGPKIGRDVAIGTGAKILGDLTIGDGAQIGANAVVVRDVPAGATVVAIRAEQTAGSEREARSENQ
jgi:serine O-acetyltransferase